jgi:CRISPR/Cas system CSM-associated protein Csm3 (group 7 of RAMP superfamily)
MPAQGQNNRLHGHLQAELNIQPIKNRIARIVITKTPCSTSIVLPNVAFDFIVPISQQENTPWAMGLAHTLQAFKQGQPWPSHLGVTAC